MWLTANRDLQEARDLSTLKDVAEVAGVSVATVSNVLTGKRSVSPELAARVRTAVKQLNYVPNLLASGLRSGETKTIGLVLPDNSNPFFAELSCAIEDEGFRAGYNVVLCNTHNKAERAEAYINTLLAQKVDGVLFISSGCDDAILRQLLLHAMPVTLIDRELPLAEPDMILVDNRQAGRAATSYLLGLGHREIACLAGGTDLQPSNDRVAGYMDAMAEVEGAVPHRVMHVDFSYEAGRQASLEILSKPVRPTAIFACNDLLALGVLSGARSLGMDIPADLSLLGFDGISLTSAVSPAIATMRQPVRALANAALESLLRRMSPRDDGQGRRIVLSATLMEGESCAPPRSIASS